MNEEKMALETMVEEGAAYVEEYLRVGKGKTVDIKQLKEIIDIYHDYLLLINVLGE